MHIDLEPVFKEASSSVQGVIVLVENWLMSSKPSEDETSKRSLKQQNDLTFLGQVTEQLSASLASGLSGLTKSVDSLTSNKSAGSLTDNDKEQGPLDFLRIAFPLDGLKTVHPKLMQKDCKCKPGHTVGYFQSRRAKEENTCTCIDAKGRTDSLGFIVHFPDSEVQTKARDNAQNEPGHHILRFRVFLRDAFQFLGSPKGDFARVQGEPGVSEPPRFEEESPIDGDLQRAFILKPGIPRFSVKLPNIDKLRSSPLATSLAEFMELVPQLGKSPQDYPDKRKLFSVQDFFQYTESEGRKLFDELDRDKDGQVNLEDLELAMKKRRLPPNYARKFLQRSKKHWLKKSFGWNEFLAMMEQKEPMMLRAFNSLSLSKSGTLQKGQVLTLLRNAGLPATEDNAAAMMRFLDSDTKGSVTYGQFRNFLVLLPPERLFDDPRMIWFEAATVVPMAPPLEMAAGSVLKSALAGGLACALSTSLLHPLDTLKTRVQASTLSFPELVSNIPSIGIKGLYRGSAPAIIGQFSSHGLRTGIFEASKLLLFNIAPSLPELQVQSMASFCSTFLGTAMRIPCEVLKQRLQAGLYQNVGEAITGTLQKDGWKGFFRGTGATLCREVPFYVAGMLIYEEAKKVAQNVLKRDLVPWEFIAIGGLSGGLAAVCTTPFDVMKTRMMTATPGISVTMSSIAMKIVDEEGLMALFKGAIPRFFWIAPLGAMNFAGYELAKRAMENKE